jgi:ABC-2 type transport system ATP-binding protein
LHQGRILCQGPVQQLCQRRQDRYRLQIQGDPNGFLDDLRLEGVQILHDNERGEYRVQVPPGWTTQAFFKLAQVHNNVVRGLQPDDEDLEELFHRVIEENQPSQGT